jgi:hypothetical protein
LQPISKKLHAYYYAAISCLTGLLGLWRLGQCPGGMGKQADLAVDGQLPENMLFYRCGKI